MWVKETWETEEDVERDIREMTEYSAPTPEDLNPSINKVPDTILLYRKQMAENKQSTLNGDLDDNASYIVSGRGRGIRDRVIRPGGLIDSHPMDDEDLKKQIRQVAGFGYSNELIEQSIKAKCYDGSSSGDSNSNFRLVSSTQTTPTKRKNIIKVDKQI